MPDLLRLLQLMAMLHCPCWEVQLWQLLVLLVLAQHGLPPCPLLRLPLLDAAGQYCLCAVAPSSRQAQDHCYCHQQQNPHGQHHAV